MRLFEHVLIAWTRGWVEQRIGPCELWRGYTAVERWTRTDSKVRFCFSVKPYPSDTATTSHSPFHRIISNCYSTQLLTVIFLPFICRFDGNRSLDEGGGSGNGRWIDAGPVLRERGHCQRHRGLVPRGAVTGWVGVNAGGYLQEQAPDCRAWLRSGVHAPPHIYNGHRVKLNCCCWWWWYSSSLLLFLSSCLLLLLLLLVVEFIFYALSSVYTFAAPHLSVQYRLGGG